MKRTYLSATTCVILLFSARAEQTNSIPVVNWGKPVFGVQIADEFANPEVKHGTVQSICLKIKNTSTNVISLGIPAWPPPGMLTNNVGKKYELQQFNLSGIDGMWNLTLLPGETKEDCIKMIVGNEVEPGDYTFVAQPRQITIAGKFCRLAPGVQTVHVK